MGQAHSNEYNCDDVGGPSGSAAGRIQDVSDCELNTNNGSYDRGRSGLRGFSISSKISKVDERQQHHVRKLSNVSHRNIQLLSMRPRSEKDAYADDLRRRRRSSLINLILGAPSSGPRFCDDLCSLSSHISELYFGIESFPEISNYAGSTRSTLRLASIEETERADSRSGPKQPASQRVRRSSIGSFTEAAVSVDPSGFKECKPVGRAPPVQDKHAISRNPSLASTLASIDLTSSFEQPGKSSLYKMPTPVGPNTYAQRPPLVKSRQLENDNHVSAELLKQQLTKAPLSRGRINQTARVIRKTGSELSLYSTISAGSSVGSSSRASTNGTTKPHETSPPRGNSIHAETKLIILLQVALPFMLAGFGNMAAGLVLDSVSQRHAFVTAPILFVLLPPLIGLKGNIEMTMASRFSTLSNLSLLQTSHQCWRAYMSNLTLVISQAIGLSLFAATVSLACELSMSGSGVSQDLNSKIDLTIGSTTLALFASALTTCLVLVIISSIVMSSAVALASLLQVNPDNLSTLIAAMYGDVSCVYVYGLVVDWIFSLVERDMLIWPSIIVASTLFLWPISLLLSYKFEETHNQALYSLPPMIISIMISMGSGALLSVFVARFRLIALYQPVVNGFGANLVAVQASRVSTWLWCSVLSKSPTSCDGDDEPRELPSKVIGSLASFAAPKALADQRDQSQSFIMNSIRVIVKSVRLLLWSFCNSSPNATAARLLLIMLVPAHTIYFFVIWLLSSTSSVVITWQFYTIYIGLCLVQVSFLLTICEPFMTLLMSRNLDPDVFGISILMAVADLMGTVCLTASFFLLASVGDVNANQ